MVSRLSSAILPLHGGNTGAIPVHQRMESACGTLREWSAVTIRSWLDVAICVNRGASSAVLASRKEPARDANCHGCAHVAGFVGVPPIMGTPAR